MRLTLIAAAAALLSVPALAAPTTYDGITFVDGDVSFADRVVLYDPLSDGFDPDGNGKQFSDGFPGPGPLAGAPYTDPNEALGAPDYTGGNTNTDGYTTLGDGGVLILEFVDNALTGSNSADADLHVFEVGTDVEDTYVWIRQTELSPWLFVGRGLGGTTSFDIDPILQAEGLSPFTRFGFVAILDDAARDGQSGNFVGADIDAVGAISNSAPINPIPVPGGLAVAGLVCLGMARLTHGHVTRR